MSGLASPRPARVAAAVAQPYTAVRFVETAVGPRVVAATTSAVDIIRAMPDGSLGVETVALPVSLSLTGVVDLNGDAQDDLLFTGSEVLSLLADGAGSFVPATVVPQSCFQPSLVHWGLDDPIDLVCWLLTLQPFVLDGSGEGTFSVGADVPTLADATAAVADLDGDGRSELVRVQGFVTDWLPIPPAGAEASPLLPRSSGRRVLHTLATNNGPETVVALTEVGGFPGWGLLEAIFDGSVFRYSMSNPSIAYADDVDGDGNGDLVFLAGAAGSPLFAILGAPGTDDGASPLGCLQIYEIPEPASTSSVNAFGDLDGDGQLELFSAGAMGLQHFVLQ